jgi:hypothetical protein
MKSILESDCRAWNEGDLDGIFRLFHEDAEYEGTSKRLRGRSQIRHMYEDTFKRGAAKELMDGPMELKGGIWAVVLYSHEQPVAVKEFTFFGDLIAGHNLIEDPGAIAQKLAG